MKSRLIFLSVVISAIAVISLCWPLHRANGDDKAPAVKLVPGLTLSFQNAKGETVDAREARLIALMVPAGTPASPMLEIGPWQATWTGIITTKIKDTYRFAAEGSGDLTVTLNDKPLMTLHGDFTNHTTDPIQLKKGKNHLVVVYHSPPTGDAKISLLWAASGKTLEPISPAVFTHDSSDVVFASHQAVRSGRELIAQMRCAACHKDVTGQMPELKQDAPNLTDIKTRLNADWVAYWITNPKLLRPTASMPRIFHDAPVAAQPTVDPRAGDIAAYLCLMPSAPSSPPVTDPAVLARGARLFTGLGCVACHVAPGVDDSDPTLNRVPLKFVKAKFAEGQLEAFLKKPEAHYAWIKMPEFHLSDVEASSLAAWLISSCKDDALPAVAKKFDAANGKKLFESSGCTSCHAVGNSQPTSASVPMDPVRDTGGCLADEVGQIGKGVDFQFTPDERASLRALLATDWKPLLQRDPLPEFTARQMSELRCTACHSMDGRDNTWSGLDTEIGTIEQSLPPRTDDDPEPKGDQSRPPLTWTGEKLQPTWMANFIAGKISYKPRPWLFARMPSFTSRAELLSHGLALSHGCPATDEVRPAVDDKLADIGKQLTSQTGLGCVKCHAVGDQAALAPFEAEAPNFAHVEARLRHEYFTHWMRNPQYYLPGTKMPSFSDANGQTALKDVLNGNAAAEFEAIWNYLRAGEKIVPVQ